MRRVGDSRARRSCGGFGLGWGGEGASDQGRDRRARGGRRRPTAADLARGKRRARSTQMGDGHQTPDQPARRADIAGPGATAAIRAARARTRRASAPTTGSGARGRPAALPQRRDRPKIAHLLLHLVPEPEACCDGRCDRAHSPRQADSVAATEPAEARAHDDAAAARARRCQGCARAPAGKGRGARSEGLLQRHVLRLSGCIDKKNAWVGYWTPGLCRPSCVV